MAAYYNEIDPKAAAWLRELIKQGHIADGEVDERSITEVHASDVRRFTQCHFFAGIGVWSHALRGAGWRDDREVWTGSCPCQPFSTAGAGKGTEDERHLFPVFRDLIRECLPPAVFGEQVSGKAGMSWLDHVQTDLEESDYAFGSVTFPACSVGAPHMRQRLYWCGANQLDDSTSDGQQRQGKESPTETRETFNGQREARPERRGPSNQWANSNIVPDDQLAYSESTERKRHRNPRHRRNGSSNSSPTGRPNPTNGFWANPDRLGCRDGKFRPVEPGTSPLVDGAPQRVGLLRGYGNAIVGPQAKIFIETVMEVT